MDGRGGIGDSMEVKAPSCGHMIAVQLSSVQSISIGMVYWERFSSNNQTKHSYCVSHYTLIFVIYIHDEIWHALDVIVSLWTSVNVSMIKSTTVENTLVKFSPLCLCPALGASWGKFRCARQGWRHATARGPASPHSVPAPPTSGHAGRQQSGALGALQKHSMYREVYKQYKCSQ